MAGARVARAEVAGWIIGRQAFWRDLFHLSLPGTLGALRRDQDPIARERVKPSVGEIEHAHFVWE